MQRRPPEGSFWNERGMRVDWVWSERWVLDKALRAQAGMLQPPFCSFPWGTVGLRDRLWGQGSSDHIPERKDVKKRPLAGHQDLEQEVSAKELAGPEYPNSNRN